MALTLRQLSAATLLSLPLLFMGCADNNEDTESPIKLSMNLPDSMTGGRTANISNKPSAYASTSGLHQAAISEPCTFIGSGNEEPFKNGHTMTKFLIGASATWTCIADLLIAYSYELPNDDQIYATGNDTLASNYDPKDPTHYRITQVSEQEKVIRMYYGYPLAVPPTQSDIEAFYVTWNVDANGGLTGRLIIDAEAIDGTTNGDNKHPSQMRMDFDYGAAVKTADMFLKFLDSNQWAEGFRIRIVESLNSVSGQERFTAQGLLAMKAQFSPYENITEVPNVRIFSVSNELGKGAAVAEAQDFALPFMINEDLNNHLGHYLATKTDAYYFKGDVSHAQPWDFVNKSFTQAVLRGGRTTAETDGRWVPFNPSLDMIRIALELSDTYFTGTECANVDDDCLELLNAIFVDGFAGQEPNQGEDPMDWRSNTLSTPSYLDTVYPNGSSWDGAFDR